MKKVLLTLLAILLVFGVVAAAGFTGYRFGYIRGLQTTAGGQAPEPRPFANAGPRGMPMHNLGMERGFHRGFGMGGFPMMGFGFFSPPRFLVQITVLALIIWFAYWISTRSGWRLTRTTQTTEPQQSVTETEAQG